MLTTYTLAEGRSVIREGLLGEAELRAAVWLDLLNPTPAEESAVQAALGFEIPTREEMQEIESSSRLYREDEVLFLTANFLYGVDTGNYGSTAITFVLAPRALVTVRYQTPRAFGAFAARCRKSPHLLGSPDGVMLHLFEQVVDRLADILERVGADMDRASQTAFRSAQTKEKAAKRDTALRETLLTIGRVGEVTTRASETLLGLSRILTFVGAEKATAVRKENQVLIKTLVRDVRSLVDHAGLLNSKASFLLDAVLGLLNVEQNTIIKVFTIVASVLMPPTVIGTIYGMNFDLMPELRQPWGYPAALLMMVLSAVLPMLYFKRKGWL